MAYRQGIVNEVGEPLGIETIYETTPTMVTCGQSMIPETGDRIEKIQ